MKIKLLFLLPLWMTLAACGGGGSGTSNATPSNDETTALRDLLSTGTNVSDTATQWECTGSDGTNPVSFNQRLFSDGNGQTITRFTDSNGIAVTQVDGFQWTPISDNSLRITVPGVTEFTINNITISTSETSNDHYDGIDTRDGSALSCQLSSAGSIDPGPVDPGPVDPGPVDPGPVDPGPVDPGPTQAEQTKERLTTGSAPGDLSESWSCSTPDSDSQNFYFWNNENALILLRTSNRRVFTEWRVKSDTAELIIDGVAGTATFSGEEQLVLALGGDNYNCVLSSVQPITTILKSDVLSGGNDTFKWTCGENVHYFWSDGSGQSRPVNDDSFYAAYNWIASDTDQKIQIILGTGTMSDFTEVKFQTLYDFSANWQGSSIQCRQ